MQLRKLIVGISSRALFDLSDSHAIFETSGVDDYARYQIEHENDILQPGSAFYLIKKFLNLRDPKTEQALVEVVLLSRNSADTGLRIFNSIQHYGLPIQRAAFTSGLSPYPYAKAFSTDLFLSTHAEDVIKALESNIAAATILPSASQDDPQGLLKIAFDGDAVLFSDESEQVYQREGLQAFTHFELSQAQTPLMGGPFKGFLQALHHIQRQFPDDQCPIRTALVTARSAPAHERVIRTLRFWNIRIDEAIFLGGLSKGDFLQAFGADCFFDDQNGHCDSARQHVTTGHVPYGVTNLS